MRSLQKALVAIVILAIVLLGSGYLLVRSSDLGQAALALPAVRAKAKSHGLPLTFEELRASIPVPRPADNAVETYRSLPHFTSFNYNDVLLSEAPDSTQIASAEAALVPMAKAMTRVRAASLKPACFFDRRWEDGPNVLFPEMALIKYYATLFCLRADLLSRKGLYPQAFADLETANRLALHAGSEPTLISLLIRNTIEARALAVAEKIVRFSEGKPDVLRAARQLQSRLLPPPDIHYYLGDSVLLYLPLIEGASNTSNDLNLTGIYAEEKAQKRLLKGIRAPFGRTRIAIDAYTSRVIDFYDRLYLLTAKENTLTPHERLEAIQALAKEADAQRGNSYIFAQTITTTAFYEPIVETIAKRRLFDVMLTLFEYRNRHHEFPDELPDSPACIDPFTDERLHYHTQYPGFILWSNGKDLVDDDGKGRESGWAPSSDIVVRFPAAFGIMRTYWKPTTSTGP